MAVEGAWLSRTQPVLSDPGPARESPLEELPKGPMAVAILGGEWCL